uniref:Uncharacterized protein n=1 Tax=Phytophthora ramorum TaxID=164328 RepID=H3GSR1_PHYRM
MTRQPPSRSPLSAPSSLSARLHRVSSPVPAGPGSGGGLRSQTLLARLFRRKEQQSPMAPQPLNDSIRTLYGEEEETKTHVDSPMRALLRSLSLQRSSRSADSKTEALTPRSDAAQVLLEGVLTELLQQRYWRSKPCYLVLEQTLDSGAGSQLRFTLRQFRFLAESRKPGRLVSIVTLSQNDVVTELRSHRQISQEKVKTVQRERHSYCD